MIGEIDVIFDRTRIPIGFEPSQASQDHTHVSRSTFESYPQVEGGCAADAAGDKKRAQLTLTHGGVDDSFPGASPEEEWASIISFADLETDVDEEAFPPVVRPNPLSTPESPPEDPLTLKNTEEGGESDLPEGVDSVEDFINEAPSDDSEEMCARDGDASWESLLSSAEEEDTVDEEDLPPTARLRRNADDDFEDLA